MEEIHKFRVFNKLKSVYRITSVESRNESTAEHTWGCLILADYFLSKFNFDLDKLKIYDLLLYHDVVEIEAGDTPLHPDYQRIDKYEKEKKAANVLFKKLPSPLNKKFIDLFFEFEEQKTPEAKFAKAIDAMEVIIHQLDYKEDWKGWSEKFLLDQKLKFFEDFPELKTVFFDLLDYLKNQNYFN
jgi:putative hydrolase of HD superfamily